jgi:hypothetical protein
MVKQEEWVTREKIATTAKVARYVVFNDAIGVDRTDTIDKDINNYYHDKIEAYAGERWMKSGRKKRLRERVESKTRSCDRGTSCPF